MPDVMAPASTASRSESVGDNRLLAAHRSLFIHHDSVPRLLLRACGRGRSGELTRLCPPRARLGRIHARLDSTFALPEPPVQGRRNDGDPDEDVEDGEELRCVGGRREVAEADRRHGDHAEVERVDPAPVVLLPAEDQGTNRHERCSGHPQGGDVPRDAFISFVTLVAHVHQSIWPSRSAGGRSRSRRCSLTQTGAQ